MSDSGVMCIYLQHKLDRHVSIFLAQLWLADLKYLYTYIHKCIHIHYILCTCMYPIYTFLAELFLMGTTVQGLLDWFEVDLRFTELSFIQIDLCVRCDFVYMYVSDIHFSC